MNQPAAYTPLESLFLFQSLLTHGVDNGAFVRISELLRSNALIKSGKTYDPARLSPDALEQLFLLLLRDELRSEAERAEGGGGGDGTGSPGSRKRKLGSPPLPTLKDVYENVEKVPILVDRLYARYRDHMVNLIRDDERKFATLQREIQLLERNERERLAKLAASQNQNQNQNSTPVLAPRDPKAPTTANGPAPSPGPIVGTPASVRRGPTPNTPILPPKLPTPTIAVPKPAPPSHLPAGTQPPRPSASPKPPNGTASVLQAPAGPSTQPTQPGPRVLQPPPQPPKQVISPRLEGAVPNPQTVPGAPQVASPAAGTLKWEKPYQPPQPTQAPPAGQFPPTIAPNNAAHQKIQQQQQWQQQVQPPHPQHQLQQQPPQQQQIQYPSQPHGQAIHPQPPTRPPTTKPVLVPPPSAGQLVPPLQSGPPRPVSAGVPQQARPPPTTPGRPIQPQQPQQLQQPQQAQQTPQVQQVQRPQLPQTQLAQKFQQVPKTQTPRPIASASSAPTKGTPGPIASTPTKGTAGPVPPQRWQPNIAPQQGQHASPAASSAPPASLKDKPYASPYGTQAPRPAIPEHMIRQAATTPGPARRLSPASSLPRTPAPSSPVSLKRGFGTKWASNSTPSTPKPTASEPQSPAYEPVSPPQRPTVPKGSTTKPVPTLQAVPKSVSKLEATPAIKTPRGRPTRTVQRGRGTSATPSITGTRRSQSVASQTDELSMDHNMTTTKVKKEVVTPRLREETGDTTADESVIGRALVTPGSISRVGKRKRPEIPVELQGPPTHVLWTRGFTKVSSSALDQISSHRDANMFATALREKDAPNYRQIVLQPQDITSIRSAIKAGNKAALQAAANLPGGDPGGTASVWLPISDDLIPPKGIINSAHLERELVHMFCNAIMYNPDPNRGPGPAFLKRSQSDEEEVVGYRLDENGVVKNTQSMFLEVEKLLGDLRAAEKERGIPPISTTRQGSVVTPADDSAEDEDELAGDGDSASVSGTVKRRRISTRG